MEQILDSLTKDDWHRLNTAYALGFAKAAMKCAFERNEYSWLEEAIRIIESL
jgi:hypothetical protein